MISILCNAPDTATGSSYRLHPRVLIQVLWLHTGIHDESTALFHLWRRPVPVVEAFRSERKGDLGIPEETTQDYNSSLGNDALIMIMAKQSQSSTSGKCQRENLARGSERVLCAGQSSNIAIKALYRLQNGIGTVGTIIC